MPSPDPAAVLSRGLAVFPIPAGLKHTPGWQDTSIADAEQLRRLWRDGDNIGIGCRDNGLVVLDLDRKNGLDGVADLKARCAEARQPWPDTFTVSTPSGGLHLYYRLPAGRVIGSTSKGRSRLGLGVDTRGPGRRHGGYVVGPGSLIEGRPYEVRHDLVIIELPSWIADTLENATAAVRR